MALKTLASVWTNEKPGSKAAFTGYMEGPNRTRGAKVYVFRNAAATPENRQPVYRICVEDGEPAPTSPNAMHNLSDEETPF